MNMTFWLIAVFFIVLALALIIPPLWKKKVFSHSDSDQRNIKIARERLEALKQQLQAGVLTQDQFDDQYQELELALSDDLDITEQPEQSPTQGRWAVPVIITLLPVLAVSLYLSLGEPDALIKAKARQPMSEQNTDIDTMVSGLAQRLKQQPDNAEGWLMLGRSYKYLKQYDKAAHAFENAYMLMGDQAEVMLQYADALAMTNGGKLAGKPAELVFKALSIAPNDITGLWLAGMAKAEAGDFSQAMKYWQKLQPLLPPGSASSLELQNMIAEAKAQLPGVQADEFTLVIDPVSINVQVNLSTDIKLKVQPDDTIFVYAQALTGPKMPLAIVRRKVSELPFTVTLSDSMAMVPAMKLSNYKQIKVSARISKSGNAMQQEGDYIGIVETVKISDNNKVAIIINTKI